MAQTAQHTPGPWSSEWQFIVAPDVTGNHIDVYIAEICEEDDEGRVVGQEEQQANAQLIAAAPDMVKALEKGMASLKPEFDKYDAEKWHDAEARDAYIAMRAALAKAGIQ